MYPRCYGFPIFRRSSSSSSSTSSDSSKSNDGSSTESSSDSTKLLEKLQKQRQKQIEERKRQKELMKATETPEEKRLRRLKKKEAKERRRKERMGWDNDYLHYTNTDNPFGDGNILSTFVWSKKLGKEGLLGVGREELEMRNRYKQEENKRELEKVKKRRQERELERQQREEEMTMLQRGKEAAQLEQWARQEDQFHLEQARLRSRIRIQDGRAKPIDLLAKYISAEEEVDAVEMHEPYTYLRGLHVKDLEDLIEDIKVYKELERGKNLDYWNDITVIVEDELHKLRKLERTEYEVGKKSDSYLFSRVFSSSFSLVCTTNRTFSFFFFQPLVGEREFMNRWRKTLRPFLRVKPRRSWKPCNYRYRRRLRESRRASISDTGRVCCRS